MKAITKLLGGKRANNATEKKQTTKSNKPTRNTARRTTTNNNRRKMQSKRQTANLGVYSEDEESTTTPQAQPQALVAPPTNRKIEKWVLKFNKLVDEFWAFRLESSPEFASSLGLMPQLANKLTDHSLPAHAKRVSVVDGFAQRLDGLLRNVDLDELAVEQRNTVHLLQTTLVHFKTRSSENRHLLPIHRTAGPHITLTNLFRTSKVDTQADFDAYAERVRSIPAFLRHITELMEQGIKEGVTPSKLALAGVEQQILATVASRPTPFEAPCERVSGVVSQASVTAVRDEVTNSVVPAFRELANFVANAYLDACSEDASAPKAFDQALKHHANVQSTGEELHELGKVECKRIREEMDSLANKAGFSTIEEYSNYLRTCGDHVVQDAQELLSFYRARCCAVLPRMTEVVKTLPRTPFGVRAADAPGAQTAVYQASVEYPTAWLNVGADSLQDRFTFEVETMVALHGSPGHHLRTTLIQENDSLAPFRRFVENDSSSLYPSYTAFKEGWALHAMSSLGPNVGLFTTNASRYGKLSYEMWQACKLVMDTGVHVMDWTREQAIDFMAENAVMSDEACELEYLACVSEPGLASAPTAGALELQQLVQLAKSLLGERFDSREFYDIVLGSGPMPWDMLEKQVARFLDEN